MKKINGIFLLILILFVTLTSCVKDPEDKSVEQDLSCLLTEYIGNDWQYYFSYDQKDRLERVLYDSDNGSYSYEVTDYTDGKVSQIVLINDGYESFYEQYYFGTNELTVEYYSKDGIENWYLEDRYEYTYDSQGQVKKRDWYYDANDGYGLNLIGYRKYTWRSGNIIKREYWYSNKKSAKLDRQNLFDPYEPKHHLKSTNDEISYTANFEYDNKPNAKASIGLFWLDVTFSANNITKATYTYNDGSINVSNISYSYQANGFPEYSTEAYKAEGENTVYYENFYHYQCD